MSSMLQKIANIKLTKVPTNEVVKFESLWQDGDVVVYFLRRFGCPVCRWISKNISNLKPVLDENNVKLIGIGPEQNGAIQFHNDKIFAGDIFVDDKKQCYKELGYGSVSLIGALGSAFDKASKDLASKAKAENLGGNFKGDWYQLGGVLIIQKGGEEILKSFIQSKPSDYIENKEILGVLNIDATLAEKLDGPDSCYSDACGI